MESIAHVHYEDTNSSETTCKAVAVWAIHLAAVIFAHDFDGGIVTTVVQNSRKNSQNIGTLYTNSAENPVFKGGTIVLWGWRPSAQRV